MTMIAPARDGRRHELAADAHRRMATRLLAAIVMALLPISAAAQSTHLLIVVGLAGDPEHGELFQKWGATLADAAAQKLGVPKENVTLLSGDRATKEEVTKAVGALATAAGEEDTVMIVLFGHGTFANKVAKFNLKGPDMTPDDFGGLLKRLRSKRVVFVDTASASGPFLESLSGAGRVVVTATRTGAEQFATLFGGPFVEAFTTDAADADRNGRVSVLEAFEYARRQVAASYQREGLMQTEHALLDDNGDREGSMEPGPQAKDGQSAAVLSLGSSRREAAPANEKLRGLYAERQALERRIESLKLLKSGMDPDKYAAELEKLATDLALKSRQIREAEGGK
jgi:peptidase C13-like protein